jgi:hypothetical protein
LRGDLSQLSATVLSRRGFFFDSHDLTVMRFTVSTKIILGLAVVLTAGTLSMLIIYRGLNALQKGIHELADVKEPISAAAYEMEVNVNGMGLGVLKFLDTLDPTYRALVEKDEADFERFHAKYLQLARTSEEQQLGARIGSLYKEFSSLARALMRIREEQEALFTAIGVCGFSYRSGFPFDSRNHRAGDDFDGRNRGRPSRGFELSSRPAKPR